MADAGRLLYQSRGNGRRALSARYHGIYDRRRRAHAQRACAVAVGRGDARRRGRGVGGQCHCQPHGVQGRAGYDRAHPLRPVCQNALPLRPPDGRGNGAFARFPPVHGYIQRTQYGRHDAAHRRARADLARRRGRAHLHGRSHARAHPSHHGAVPRGHLRICRQEGH